jgi:hypothetical protein
MKRGVEFATHMIASASLQSKVRDALADAIIAAVLAVCPEPPEQAPRLGVNVAHRLAGFVRNGCDGSVGMTCDLYQPLPLTATLIHASGGVWVDSCGNAHWRAGAVRLANKAYLRGGLKSLDGPMAPTAAYPELAWQPDDATYARMTESRYILEEIEQDRLDVARWSILRDSIEDEPALSDAQRRYASNRVTAAMRCVQLIEDIRTHGRYESSLLGDRPDGGGDDHD